MIGAAKFLMAMGNAVAPPFDPTDWGQLVRGLDIGFNNWVIGSGSASGLAIATQFPSSGLSSSINAGGSWIDIAPIIPVANGDFFGCYTDDSLSFAAVQDFVLKNNYIAVSSDNHQTWSATLLGSSLPQVAAFYPLVSAGSYIASASANVNYQALLYTTANSGGAWATVVHDANYRSFTKNSSGDLIAVGRLSSMAIQNGSPVIRRSSDGVIFSDAVVDTFSNVSQVLFVDSSADIVVALGVGVTDADTRYYISLDGGLNYTSQLIGERARGVVSVGGGVWIIALDGSRVLYTDDDFSTSAIVTMSASMPVVAQALFKTGGKVIQLGQDGYALINPPL